MLDGLASKEKAFFYVGIFRVVFRTIVRLDIQNLSGIFILQPP